MLSSFLQNELVSLSTEAKKKGNEAVKDSSEKLLFNLKKIKNEGLDLVTELEKSPETMIPFLLSFESKQQKLISISVGCIQKLISHNAIPQSDLSPLLQCLSSTDGSMAVLEIQFKILQILLPFCTNYPKVVFGDLLASCLLLCYKYSIDTKTPVLSNTASATFRQMILHTFERLDSTSEGDEHGRSDSNNKDLSEGSAKGFTSMYKRDALSIFQDLCCLTSGEQGSFLKIPQMSKSLALELIESILVSNPKAFVNNQNLKALIKDKVCPVLIRLFSDKTEFPLMMRIVRTVRVIIKSFLTCLPMECEILLTLFCKILETSQYMAWQRILILESIKGLLNESELQASLFHTFDKAVHSVNIYADIVTAVCAVAFDARNYLLFYVNPTSPGTSQPGDEVVALSIVTAGVRIPCLEQLEKNEPPSFPDAYPILLAFQCIGLIIDFQYESFMSKLEMKKEDLPTPLNVSQRSESQEGQDEILLAIEMAKCTFIPVFYSLSYFLVASVDEDVFGKTLKNIHRITYLVGLLGLTTFRDAFISLLCRISVSTQLPPGLESLKSIPKEIETIHFPNASLVKSLVVMSDKNMSVLSCLLQTSESLIHEMDSKTWFAVVETLAVVDSLIVPRQQFRKMDSAVLEGLNTQASGATTAKETTKPKVMVSTNATYLEAYAMRYQNAGIDFQLQNSQYNTVTKHLFELTCTMKQKPFLEFIKAFCRLAHESIPISGGGGAHQVKEKIVDDKSFALSKLYEITLLNIKRIVEEDSSFFDLVSNQFINLAHIPSCPFSIRIQACLVLGEIVLNASEQPEFSTSEQVELRLIDSIRILMAFESTTAVNEEQAAQQDQTDISLSKLPFLVEVRKQGLEIINKMIQRSGQNIKNGMLAILEIIYSLVKSSSIKRMAPPQSNVSSPTSTDLMNDSYVKNSNLVRIGFPSVQLICTDFMNSLSPMGLSRCIQTVSAFGSSADDLNISLTSVGLLWSLCDFILTKREKLEKANEERHDKEDSAEQDESVIKGSLLDLSNITGPVTISTMDSLWMYLLKNLSELCSDPRPEVRNSSNQTLFRTISMNGQRLNLDSWDLCLSRVLFPLLERIQNGASNIREGDKAWDETKILTLNGISRALVDFLPVLVQLEDRFDNDWLTFLNYMKSTCLDSSQEVAIATLKTFKMLISYPSKEDIPENVKSKIPSLWRACLDVWFQLGQEIILQAQNEIAPSLKTQTLFKWSNGAYPSLLCGFFSQETLSLYISLIFEIQPVIKDGFKADDYIKIARLFQTLVLYHSRPSANSTASRIRAEIVNDLDNPTPFQSHFVDYLSGKLQVAFTDDGVKKETFLILSDLVINPFIPFPSPPGEYVYTAQFGRRHTFMAMTKKILVILVDMFQQNKMLLFQHSCFQNALQSLSIPLQYKYECPATSGKDLVSLYRASAQTAINLVSTAIVDFPLDQSIISQDVLESIYESICRVYEDLLLSGSISPHPPTSDQFIDDENFDLSLVVLLEKEILPFLGSLSIPEQYCDRAIRILVKLSKYDFQDAPVALSFKQAIVERSGSRNVMSPETSILPGSPKSPSMAFIGPDQSSPQREKVANACIETLFRISSLKSGEQDGPLSNRRISTLSIPLLIEKCSTCIQKFIKDRPISGRLPLPRCRNQEIILLLSLLTTLKVNSKDQDTTPVVLHLALVQSFLLASETAPLFLLYQDLCDLLRTVSSYSALASINSEDGTRLSQETQMTHLVLTCLARIGSLFK